MNPTLFIGMISGTSRDGVDAVLVNLKRDHWEVREAVCVPYPADLARLLQDQMNTGRRPDPDVLAELDEQLAVHFSHTVYKLLKQAATDAQQVSAIGSHGQTVWHQPDGPRPESIQLGDPNRIAQKTGIVTVGDFRRADIEAGGQGAPLAPLLHRALFRPVQGNRVVVNLGGIANISIISSEGEVAGFDTGPANCLLDAWIRTHRGDAFDQDGDWAAGGRVNQGMLREMLTDPYFQRHPPKSTGIEYFNLSWLGRFIQQTDFDPRDVQATLAELSAVSIADSIQPRHPGDVLVCGGGVHNLDLMRRLQALLPGTEVKSTANSGLDPDWVEAVLFAWLASERLAQRPLDTGSITGARHPVLLGTIANPC